MSEHPSVSERMRGDWNERAKEDAHYYVAFGGRDQDEEAFLATAADVLRLIEAELKRFPKGTDWRALRALEIGCGPGRLMKSLSGRFGEIHGVDVSDEMIRLARERLRDIPNARVYTNNGASLAQFAAESLDFVYSYAVFQHIPSREVILEYIRETRRVLKPGGVFVGQFNGLPHQSMPDTWAGVSFTSDDIRAFARDNNLRLLNLTGVGTQYMWATFRKQPFLPPTAHRLPPEIHRLTNASSWEPIAPNRGRHAAVSIWIKNLPDDCDLNNLEVVMDTTPGIPFYVAPPGTDGIQQVNGWLPQGIRTGLLPVEVRMNGKRLCAPATLRVIPAAPLVPRIVSITDGINLVEKNCSTTGHLKVQIEEVATPESIAAWINKRPIEHLEILCIDPIPPRYEVNLRLPKDLPPGRYTLEMRIGERRLLPAEIDFRLGPP
jgi:SAM-dependent methyltransferase